MPPKDKNMFPITPKRCIRIQYFDMVEVTEPLTEEEAIGAHKALSILQNMGIEDLYVHEINMSAVEAIDKQIEELTKRKRDLLYGKCES